MAALIVTTVMDALNEAGIPARQAYPGTAMPHITDVQTAVSLSKLEFTTRSATVAVTVMAPVSLGGTVCEDTAIQVGGILEDLGGVCVQGPCKFNGYADAYYAEVLGTFYGAAVMDSWKYDSGFQVTLGSTELTNAVAFRAEQAVDAETGQLLETGVWNFRLEEEYGLGELVKPSPIEPFAITVSRSGSTETYNDCNWVSVQLEDTKSGLRQVRTGIAQSRDFLIVI